MWLLWFLFNLIAQYEAAAQPPRQTVEFKRDVQPILERRCTPCHFAGGKMHHELPFDEAATIDKLGEKLMTRIKAPEEQKVIRAFLQQLP